MTYSPFLRWNLYFMTPNLYALILWNMYLVLKLFYFNYVCLWICTRVQVFAEVKNTHRILLRWSYKRL